MTTGKSAPIAVIDYGMGNLRSVQKGIERAGFAAEVTRDAARIRSAPGVVLPGVGAFSACMNNLRDCGLVDPVRGLGLLPGRVMRFADAPGLKIPHMGWNQIRKRKDVPHLRDVPEGAFVYFVHSYYVVPADESLIATTTTYGAEFTSAIAWKNVFATQYHPEKSQAVGLRILENFARLVAEQGV